MANPKIEDGYCKIANELLDAICKMNLSAYESKMFWFIIRRTYGFNKKTDRVSYNQFEQGTGIRQQHIKRTLDKLIIKKMINQNSFKYSIQKDYDKWISLPKQVVKASPSKTLPKQVVKENTTQRGSKPLPKQVVNSLPKQVDTKDKRQYIKTGDFSFLPVCFDNDLFKKSFNEFRDNRKSLKSKMTRLAEKKLLKSLSKLSNNNTDVAIKILDRSIINGWKDVFPLNNQKPKEREKIRY